MEKIGGKSKSAVSSEMLKFQALYLVVHHV